MSQAHLPRKYRRPSCHLQLAAPDQEIPTIHISSRHHEFKAKVKVLPCKTPAISAYFGALVVV